MSLSIYTGQAHLRVLKIQHLEPQALATENGMYFVFAALLLVLDQATKWWSSTTFPLNGEGRYVFLGFYFTYVQNTGAAFGIFQDGTLPLGILSGVVSLALIIYLVMKGKTIPVLQRFALSSILAGAIGNMIDRFRLGYVIDFIHFKVPGFSFPVFNVADSCVVIGAILLIGSSLFTSDKPKQTVALQNEVSE